MTLQAGCPLCAASTTGDERAPVCPTHGAVTPLWRVTEPGYDAFAQHLVRSRPLPTWLPWPLPAAWQVTDFGCVAEEGQAPLAAFATVAGPSDPDGVVELSVVTEEPGVGLGARVAGVAHTDPGLDAGGAAPTTRLRVEGAHVPFWPVSTIEAQEPLDRWVLAGEAHGRWLWLVVRPASGALLLPELGGMVDVSGLGPELVTLPFGQVPRAW